MKDQLLDRLSLLKSVQKWSKDNNYLTAGQRICLSQERAAIMRVLDAINEGAQGELTPRYVLPEHLEEKVQHLYGVMRQRWALDPKGMLEYLE